MNRLFKMTPLQDTFSCNFNILIAGSPKVMGIREILNEWIAFRRECVRRRVYFSLNKAKDRLHLLKGLEKILLDIDKAIKIIRETAEEKEVVPNLMIGFGIDQIQAEYVAEIKLRHLNREYIMNRLSDIEQLEAQVADLTETLQSKRRINSIIVKELEGVIKKHAQPRKTAVLYDVDLSTEAEEEPVDTSPVHLFYTQQGYFKKITPQSLRMSGEQKLKEGDAVQTELLSSNNAELLFFTNKCQVYKAKATDFSDGKASLLGEYLPAKLEMENDEHTVAMIATTDYKGFLLFVFENGRVAKIDLAAYQTKTNRKKLIKAYTDKFPLHSILHLQQEGEVLLTSTNGRMLLLHTGALATKTTKNNSGVAVMTQKRGQRVLSVQPYTEGMLQKPHRYRTKTLPAAGSVKTAEEQGDQLSLL